MNLFDLPDTTFLAVYVALLAVTAAGAVLLRWYHRQPADPLQRAALELDPYEVAYVVGGDARAVHAALVNLVQSDVLAVDADKRTVQTKGPAPHHMHPFVQAVYEHVAPQVTRPFKEVVESALEDVEMVRSRPRALGLVLTPGQSWIVRIVPTLLLLIALVFAALKLLFAGSADRPVESYALLGGSTFAVMIAFVSTRPFRTRRGDRAVADLRLRSAELENVATAPRGPGEELTGGDAALAFGLFGVAALASPAHRGMRSILSPLGGGGGGAGPGAAAAGGMSGAGPISVHDAEPPSSRRGAGPISAAGPFLESLGAPRHVAEAVSRLRDELARAPGSAFAGLVLYGSLVRRRYRPGRSEVSTAVLLHDAAAPSLSALAPPLRDANRAARVEPLVLGLDEVERTAHVLPTCLLDIQEHHALLAGQDAFVGLSPPRARVQAGVEAELLDLLLRLRRRYVATFDDRLALASALASAVEPLAGHLEAMLRLAGKLPIEEAGPAWVFEQASAAFELDRQALVRFAALLVGPPPDDLPILYREVLAVIGAAADAVRKT